MGCLNQKKPFSVSAETKQAEIRKACDDASPAFMERVCDEAESASKRAALARSMAALERRGLIKRWKALGRLYRDGFLPIPEGYKGNAARNTYELTKLGKTIAQDALCGL